MKRISAKEFFTVMWRGLYQALGWFFGLFGYKRDGKFAKCVWGLFATSSAIIACIFAVGFSYAAGSALYGWYTQRHHECNNPDCYENTYVSRSIYYHNQHNGKGYVYDISDGRKTVKHVAWIALPEGKDSLVCYSNGKKRGYFNKYTGEVVVSPRYDHAWVFSDGLASVEEGGYIKFIDQNGDVVIDNKMPYSPGAAYVFHGGYCMVETAHGELWGLMDKNGRMTLSPEYQTIALSDDKEHWCVQKGEEMAVLDKDLNVVVPMTSANICIADGVVNMTMRDHTIRKYDLQGTLIDDFHVTDVHTLEYEKDEILYHQETIRDDEEFQTTSIESYHPKATARLRAYVAGDDYEGLMTADGHIVTMPLYKNIVAISQDLYMCTMTNYDKILVNGRGEKVM